MIMKNIFILLGVLLLTSCTSNQRARNWGGQEEITLEPNEKLINMTWKQDNLWVLTEDTVSHVRYFRESSSFGLMEGQITIK